MRGVEYVIDESGKKRAVLIDLAAWGKLWEDFQDVLVSEARKQEPGVPWETLKTELEQEERKSA